MREAGVEPARAEAYKILSPSEAWGPPATIVHHRQIDADFRPLCSARCCPWFPFLSNGSDTGLTQALRAGLSIGPRFSRLPVGISRGVLAVPFPPGRDQPGRSSRSNRREGWRRIAGWCSPIRRGGGVQYPHPSGGLSRVGGEWKDLEENANVAQWLDRDARARVRS